MKKVEAVIRLSKFDSVKDELIEKGIEFFSYWDVRGVGLSKDQVYYRGVKFDTSSIERRVLSIIVRDQNLQKTVDAILATASTGKVGDGKIFVSDVHESFRIRTGESGPESLFIKEEE